MDFGKGKFNLKATICGNFKLFLRTKIIKIQLKIYNYCIFYYYWGSTVPVLAVLMYHKNFSKEYLEIFIYKSLKKNFEGKTFGYHLIRK